LKNEVPVEPSSRRGQTGVSFGGGLPGAALNGESAVGGQMPRGGTSRSRFDLQPVHWWRPTSRLGWCLLTLALLAVLCGLGVSAYMLKMYLGSDARFRIAGASNIEVSGISEVSREELLPVFGEDIGRNIFFVPLGERRRQLEAIPWIEKATVMRLLPDRIRIAVVERKPVAFARQGQQIGLVDANGVLLTMPVALMAQHHYSFPVVTGIDASDSPASRKARMAVYQRLIAELDANGQNASAQISEVDLTDPEDARVLMPEQGQDILAHFGEDHFFERYRRYKAHIGEWRQQYPKLQSVDLRYNQQVVLEMDPNTNVAQASAAEQAAAETNAGLDKPSTEEPVAKTSRKAGVPADRSTSVGRRAGTLADKPTSREHKTGDKSSAAARAKPDKTASRKSAARERAMKTAGKTGDQVHQKQKTKSKPPGEVSSKAKRHAAEIKRAAYNRSKRNSPPTTHSARTAGEGK
jgi:cell division protein FtsQ